MGEGVFGCFEAVLAAIARRIRSSRLVARLRQVLMVVVLALAAFGPARAQRVDPQGVPSSDREWFMTPAEVQLEIWSAETPLAPKKAPAKYFVGMISSACQGPSGATFHTGSYKVAADEYANSPRYQDSPGLVLPSGPMVVLNTARGRTTLIFYRPAGQGISCLVRASRPYGVDASNAAVELRDFRFGR